MVDRRGLLRIGASAAVAGSALVAAPAWAGPQTSDRHPKPHRTLVIGHRGAAGYRPEHTLASYELGARMGADFIEPDLCSTKDHVLVARHEPEIGGTTDVSTRPEFAGRKRTVLLDGIPTTGWFTHDFTLAELKTLRAVERLPAVRQRNTLYNGLFQVPTFQEILDLRARLSKELGRDIGVYPETKHPTYFRALGLELEPLLAQALRGNGLNRPDAPVFVQSFEAHNLQALHDEHTVRVPLVFLTSATGTPFNDPTTYATYTTPAGLRGLARYVSGIGPDKSQIIPRNADGTLATPTGLVHDAHAAGLVLHPYTFRAENQFLRTGIDGLFTDQADIGVLSRQFAFANL